MKNVRQLIDLSQRLPRPEFLGWLVVGTLFFARTFPFLTQTGMFFDGVTYAAISRNLALGVGDTWNLAFSPHATFHEHPPLAFVLESYFFRLFGDHYWVEKLYSAMTGMGTALAVAAIWRQLAGRNSPSRSAAWLPILIWIAIPNWSWMYQNNMLENTVGLFGALAVYFGLIACDGRRKLFPWLALAAICLTAALFSKGPVGLYPLITPLLAVTVLRQQTLLRSILTNLALIGLFAVLVGVVLMQEGAWESVLIYLHKQVLASVSGQRELTTSALGRYAILWNMVTQLALPTIAVALVVWMAKRRAIPEGDSIAKSEASERNKNGRAAVLCLVTAISASFPIMLSPKQFPHYAFPSYPFYSLALAWSCYDAVRSLSNAMNGAAIYRLSRSLCMASGAVILLIAVLSVAWSGTAHRDQQILRDTLALGRKLPAGATVAVHNRSANGVATFGDFAFQSYLSRWQDIQLLSKPETSSSQFVLVPAEQRDEPAGFVLEPSALTRYRLYRRVRLASEAIEAEKIDRISPVSNERESLRR